MEAARVAEVYAGGYGTGYLVARGLVLTAGHVVTDPSRISVRFLDSDDCYHGEVTWESAKRDAILIGIDDRHRPDLGLARWGRLISTASGVPWELAGFPRSQELSGGKRAAEPLRGELDPMAGAPHHVQLKLADPIPELDSPWDGISGAAVTCNGLITALVTETMPVYEHRRLTAAPVERLFADPLFCRTLNTAGGSACVLEPVELAPVLTVPSSFAAGPVTRLSPATLLRSDAEAITFHGRAEEVRRLTGWCRSSGFGLRLLTSPAGYGKSRLARRLTQILQGEGWATGDLAPGVAVAPLDDVLARLKTPTLLVVDYAETRPDQVKNLITAAVKHRGPAPLRILLIARAAGDWWQQLAAESPREVRDVLSTAPIDLIKPFTADDRAIIFADGVKGMARQISGSAPESVQVPDLSADQFGSPLRIAMEALAALLAPRRVPAPDGAEDIILDHEKPYWSTAAKAYELTLDPEDQRAAVAAAALCGAATETEALTLLRQLPGLQDNSDDGYARRRRVARWIRDLYPAQATEPGSAPSIYWGSLQPDLLAEHLVAAVAREDTGFLFRVLAEPAETQARQALRVLSRAALHEPDVASVITALIGERPDLARHAITITPQAQDPAPLLAALDAAIKNIPLQPESLDLLRELAGAFPASSLLLSSLQFKVYSAIAAIYATTGNLSTAADWESFASATAVLAGKLASQGKHYRAVQGLQIATWQYEWLAEQNPRLFLPRLAMVLTDLAEQMAKVGQPADAAAAIHRALGISERLTADDPDAHGPLLASALVSFAILFPKSRTGEALTAIRRAIGIYEDRAEQEPSMQRALAGALTTMAAICMSNQQPDEALTAARHAVTIYERLISSEDPDASQPGYADALYNLAAILAGRGQLDAALATAEKMVPIWGDLAKTAFARFGPTFLDVTTLIGFLYLELDQPRAAAFVLTGALMIGRADGLKLGNRNSVLYRAACLLRTAYREAPQDVTETWEQATGQQLPPWIRDQDSEQSEIDWYRRAAMDGNVEATCRLAWLLEEQGQIADAETWWRKAAQADDIGAMIRLADCLRRQGKLDQAEPWWRKAAEAGNTSAMINLSLLLQMRHELAEAETMAHTAALCGSVDAMNTLGIVLLQQGRPDEAETSFRKAAGLGSASAAENLRNLLQTKREHGQDALRKVRKIQWHQGGHGRT